MPPATRQRGREGGRAHPPPPPGPFPRRQPLSRPRPHRAPAMREWGSRGRRGGLDPGGSGTKPGAWLWPALSHAPWAPITTWGAAAAPPKVECQAPCRAASVGLGRSRAVPRVASPPGEQGDAGCLRIPGPWKATWTTLGWCLNTLYAAAALASLTQSKLHLFQEQFTFPTHCSTLSELQAVLKLK